MSIIDKLLQADAGSLFEVPTKKYEIKRLSKKLKEKFEIELTALPPDRYAEIQRAQIELTKKGSFHDIEMFTPKMLTLLYGIKEPNIKDKRLLSHFNLVTPKQFITKLFLAGEIDNIKNEIDKLSGYDKDDAETDEEIKN
ncbi:phage tail assembly chaperone [Pectinatus frisingensis]|uniref:phage tail assembly chaperone n=1 Tax=Pectinatus frisingensis TaxID=865 RepID=UPI0018C6BC54|nr:hypothetical protein [Pectinatus frisingensis]